MPAVAKRPCSYPAGCGALVEPGTGSGRCPGHQQSRAPVEQRGKTTDRGYGVDHRRLRVLCFARDRWRCVDCGWEPECVRVFREAGLGLPPSDAILEELRLAYARGDRHLHADHEIPIEQRPDLRLVLSNYRTRCDACHNAKTAREDGGFGRQARGLQASAIPETAH
jgi:5-methylcytosine-specific restriction endonuclease McrA